MGFNSAFKGLKLLKKPENGHLNNLNDAVLNVLNARTTSYFTSIDFFALIPVAAWSKLRVCGRWLAGIAGSNPAGGMDISVF